MQDDAPAARPVTGFASNLYKLGPGQLYEPIRAFANTLPEQAARVAGVLTLVDNIKAASIERDVFDRAIQIAGHFAAEALRLFDAGAVSPKSAAVNFCSIGFGLRGPDHLAA